MIFVINEFQTMQNWYLLKKSEKKMILFYSKIFTEFTDWTLIYVTKNMIT